MKLRIITFLGAVVAITGAGCVTDILSDATVPPMLSAPTPHSESHPTASDRQISCSVFPCPFTTPTGPWQNERQCVADSGLAVEQCQTDCDLTCITEPSLVACMTCCFNAGVAFEWNVCQGIPSL